MIEERSATYQEAVVTYVKAQLPDLAALLESAGIEGEADNLRSITDYLEQEIKEARRRCRLAR